jgi:hypothetical protein
MKKLVLGALLVVASSTGCTVSGGTSDSLVTVQWRFTHLADNSPRSCPQGFATASIVSQSIDPITHRGTGVTIVDQFNCADLEGTISLPDDTYLVWVQIESDDGSQIYTKSAQTFVDTSFGDATIDVNILDDGGYFFLTWDLVDAVTEAVLTCNEAGITANGSVETIATSVANSSYYRNDKFTCEDHFGTTDALLAGTYTVSIDAEEGNAAIGAPTNLTNRVITAPDGLTDLGHILIPID